MAEKMPVKIELQSSFIGNSQNQTLQAGENSVKLERNRHEVVKKLVETGPLLSVIRERCERILEENEENVIFEFLLPINIIELLEFDAFLGDTVIKETIEFILTLQKVIFETIQKKGWFHVSRETQILVTPIISNLPAFSGYGENNRISSEERLIKIEGTVISITPLLKYTKCAKYNCTIEDCPFYTGNDNLLVWLPGTSESSLVRSDYICDCCGSYLQEDVTYRTIGEKQIVKVILNNGLDCLHATSNSLFSRQQAVTVMLRGDLTRKVDFGVKYWITGVITREILKRGQSQSFVNIAIEAFNIEEIQQCVVSKRLLDEEIPQSIKTLYEDRAESPWSFVASLAYCFGESICISGCYNRLKTALLLSLVMLGDHVLIEDVDGKLVIGKDLSSINVFAAAEDILIIQRLFTYASTFSERTVSTVPCVGLTGDVNQIDGNVFIDGGSLLLSGKHLCNIPNISSVRKEDIEKLQKALETNSVTFNIPKKASDRTEYMQMSFQLQSTVWAAAETTTEKNASTKWKTLTEYFDLVYNFDGDYVISDEIEEDNVKAILRRSMGVEEKAEIGYEDLKTFIKFARSRRVNFSEDAAIMMKSFFLASRRARGNGLNGVEISKQSLQTLLSLAAAHAKLSLREKVLQEDALMAILLYEESLTMRSGYSVVDIRPKLHFSRENFAVNLGPKNDEWMRVLHRRVTNFCKTFSCGMSSNFYRTEE